jgi:predicted esterase
MEEIIEDEGPFDGIIGFSQGAAVAARLILLHQARDPLGPQPFKVAVFLCAASLFYADSPEEYGEKMGGVAGNMVQIPTVHVIGTKDPHRPYSLDLTKLCERKTCRIIDRVMGHEIPRGREVSEATRDAIEWAVRLSYIGS